MKINSIKPKFVKFIPEELEEGILYISKENQIAIHLCCCGCLLQTVTPLDINGWSLTINKSLISLSPSIGNFRYPCKSHYWIKENKVKWCSLT